MDIGASWFQEKDDGGAAEGKAAFFLSAFYFQSGVGFVVVDDLSYHKGTYFHHEDGAEVAGAQEGVFPGVFFVDGAAVGGGWVDGVQYSGDCAVGGAQAVVYVGVAVVIGYGETDDEGGPSGVAGCKLVIMEKLRYRVLCVFDREMLPFGDGIGTYETVTGAAKYVWV